jgi:hypothetical protein
LNNWPRDQSINIESLKTDCFRFVVCPLLALAFPG